MPQQQLAEDIQSLHDLIDEVGWVQGKQGTLAEGVCLIGGVIELDNKQRLINAGNWDERCDDLMIAIREAINERNLPIDVLGSNAPETLSISRFNDNVLKSKAEVLEFLEKTRIKAEEKA